MGLVGLDAKAWSSVKTARSVSRGDEERESKSDLKYMNQGEILESGHKMRGNGKED